MSPADYCAQKAAPAGSVFYYSVRSLSPAVRVMVEAIQAFYLELEEILVVCSDPTVAAAKFNWWRGELVNAQADHPVAIVLREGMARYSLDVMDFLKLIEGIEQVHQFLPFAILEDAVVYLIQTAGRREVLIARCCGVTGADETIYSLMLVVEWVHYIQHLRRYVQQGLMYFPKDELHKFNVTAADWHGFQTTPDIRHLLAYQAEKIERSYQQALTELHPEKKKGLSSLLIRSAIARVTLAEIQKSDYRVLENWICLTPLRCWWLAFRALR